MNIYENEFVMIGTNKVHHTAIIDDCVKLGNHNVIGAYSVIGSWGEIRGVKQEDFKGTVEIGDNNVISELVTIQRPYAEGAVTKIGNNNIITAHAHIGHDAQIGNDCEICISIIGGYAEIGDGTMVKIGCAIRNRAKIGKGVVVGMGSVVVSDVPDSVVIFGNPAKIQR